MSLPLVACRRRPASALTPDHQVRHRSLIISGSRQAPVLRERSHSSVDQTAWLSLPRTARQPIELSRKHTNLGAWTPPRPCSRLKIVRLLPGISLLISRTERCRCNEQPSFSPSGPHTRQQSWTVLKPWSLGRRFPHHVAPGTVALIYASSPVQAIVGHARIQEVKRLPIGSIWSKFADAARINRKDFDAYFAGCDRGFAIFLYDAVQLERQVKAADLKKSSGSQSTAVL